MCIVADPTSGTPKWVFYNTISTDLMTCMCMWQDNPCKLIQYICSNWTVELAMTSWYGYDFRITGPWRDNLLVTDGFRSHRANISENTVSPNKLLYKQSSCHWFELPQCFRDVTVMTVWTFLQKHLKQIETHEITYPFQNFNGTGVEAWWFYPTLCNGCKYFSC